MAGPIPISLNTVPQEVLEHIAYFAATDTFLGPPSSLLPLLATSQRLNSSLSITTNHHLYARVFGHKFDLEAPLLRLGADRLTSWALADELRRRCVVLKRLRARLDSTTRARHADEDDHKMTVHNVLFTAYILMLENEGKNKAQLMEYGHMKAWIREFWFDAHGASLAVYSIRTGNWPLNLPETALAMWLFWFFLNTDDYANANDGPEAPLNILKALALGAHRYNLTATSWVDFEPKVSTQTLEHVTLYSESMELTTPPLAAPAILSYLALVNRRRSIPLPPSQAPVPRKPFSEWDSEWGRCSTTLQPKWNLSECFKPGRYIVFLRDCSHNSCFLNSIASKVYGRGFFTYTEFTAYAALLAGAPPNVIQKSVVGKHQQTWKLREHHLVAYEASGSDSGIDMDIDKIKPLRAGDPLRSYFPTGTQIREHRDGLAVQESGTGQVLRYQRAPSLQAQQCDDQRQVYVQDIIITGEGHSAWGQFNLVGRVRPCDGFVSLSKDYVDGDRGKWLYRGYLVGNANGNFAGRWRDTLSPAEVPGYEGCFVMSRRR